MLKKSSDVLPVRYLEPFGVEVDTDLTEPLSPAQQDEFRRVFYDNEVVVFRNQCLTMQQQCRVMEMLGSILRSGEGKSVLAPDDGVLNAQPLGFHSDWYFLPVPIDAVSLHALEIEGTSWTSFLSATRAWGRMPVSLRNKISGRRAVNVDFMRPSPVPHDVPEGAFSYGHDIPLLHPFTRRPLPYIIDGYTAHITGLDPDDSRATLAEVVSYLHAPDDIYKHVWQNGDLVIWDNIATQHARPDLSGIQKRRLQRVANNRITLHEQAPGWAGLEY
jgi:taurine dioxygenase